MKKGFTLLEMVVVLTVLSIIFLLTIPNIRNVLQMVENKGCKAQLKIIDSAIIQFKLITDNYPNSLADLISEGLINDDQVKCQNGSAIYILNHQAYAE